MSINLLLPEHKIKELKILASTTHRNWDQSLPDIEKGILSQGHSIKCEDGCNECCFTRTTCSTSEGFLISDYMQKNFSPERNEFFRLRAESNNSTLKKIRQIGLCDSNKDFYRAGGMECPFLEKGRCVIYPVRPLDCRAQIATRQTKADDCRQCSLSNNCDEAKTKYIQLQKELKENECALDAPNLTEDIKEPLMSETLCAIWKAQDQFPTFQISKQTWKYRLKSKDTVFDQTWQDDRHDFNTVINFPLVLPEEGEYPPDLIVLKIQPDTHSIYFDLVKTSAVAEIRVLYKLLPGGYFDWEKKIFESKEGQEVKETHIVWMGDSLQERLMMWEAAKRCRGKVLCGGLGMGVFPQYALSLPQVKSVHIVDMNEDVISILKNTWRNHPWPGVSDCSITFSKIENFLKTTNEKFDTVYIDTWDALTEEYLPHINYLKKISKRVLKPGGEILFWGYDLMVRMCLNQAKNILSRREYFLGADEWQMKTLANQKPIFYKLVLWFNKHPHCSDEDFYSEAYRLATKEIKNMGVLSLNEHPHFENS
jgi:Fe-S-cluster containining protein